MGAGRVAMPAREMPLAKTLFLRAIERDPSSYRATLGIASTSCSSAISRAPRATFDDRRSRTDDKDEQKLLAQRSAIRYHQSQVTA